MTAILGILFPVFALIGAGWGMMRLGALRPGDGRVLSSFVLNLALPALLCGALARRDLAEVLNWGYLLAFALAGLVVMASVALAFRLAGAGPARAAAAGMGASCPNSGFVGFPILMMVMPDQAPLVLALNFLVENFLLIPVALLALDRTQEGAAGGVLRRLGVLLAGLLRRPLIIGLLAGLALSVSGLGLPAPVLRLLDITAAGASAVALVAIGAGLAGLTWQGDRGAAVAIGAAKLVLHPLAAVAVLAALPLAGLPVPDATLATALVLSAAMPMFSVFPLFVQPYGQAGLASVAVLVTTLASVGTLALALYWLA